MKEDQQVLESITQLTVKCQKFLEYIAAFKDQCAYTDRMVEEILAEGQRLKQSFESQFEYYHDELVEEHKRNLVSLFDATEDIPPLEDDELNYLCEHLAKDGTHWSLGDYMRLKFDLESEDWNIDYVLDEYGLLNEEEYEDEYEEDE